MEMVASEFDRATALHFLLISLIPLVFSRKSLCGVQSHPTWLVTQIYNPCQRGPNAEVIAKLYLIVCPQAFSDV